MTRTSIRLVHLTGGLMAAVVVLTGCSGTAGSSAASSSATDETPADQSAEFNDADVAFAQGMIPHHEGALMMAEVAVDRAADPRVVDLAERIEAGQDPEIDLMTGWLEEWGQPLEQGSGHMGGMDHGSEDMGGMGMDMEDMPSAGSDFDRMWIEAMIEHHEGAVEMARTEVEDGRDPEAIDLARVISDTQTQEIEEMRQLLSELDG
ncbi:DUF305 domain-containing protein [Blastococcus capsensis]|uniref:DUF305 domain-containing protein n=1 Tax=Blastococcus capsensis TaxID=1564163 RepID=UPI00254166AE|nr:DUF305 domain-containing protein [Blastococcus capsensis]MDK3256630.1 DUF305 domain-containing protein [Blastococcus capsensis]